jgi:hypothetical protein
LLGLEKIMKNNLLIPILAASLTLAGCAAPPAASGPAAATSNAHVKMINGKRYVWLPPSTGSNLPGRWVPEGSAGPGSNVQSMSPDAVRQLQDSGGSPMSTRGGG